MAIKVAGIAIEDEDGNILAIKRNSHVPQPDLWCLPAGKIEKGKSPIETAILKTKNEVGLKFKKEELSAQKLYKYKAGNIDIEFHTFRAKVEGIKPKIKLNKDGSDAYVWEKPDVMLRKNNLIKSLYLYLK